MAPRGYRDEDATPPEADYEDFTLERFCTSKDGRLHVEQLIAGQDRSPWIHIMAARQSGKSQIDCAILFDNARESCRFASGSASPTSATTLRTW